MAVHLSNPVAAYFAGNRNFDLQAMLAPFSSDARVLDEGRCHEGRHAIRAWIEAATIGNQALAVPRSARREAGQEVVVAEVTGPFPGSPVTLTFRFTLAQDGISRLEIG
ncbi:nuclear transport factor 2 family protein [Geminicoccus flavidas]|uniref:nuclear transport factor 2 family protein n=1 Tax=Geminicoccus flavidas TaxID=2506407 RepID=UPI001359A5E9|nr:nuclear transport factor 2 family protein [Geminicoccus flavidas]